jgi:hypothetical protein
MFWATHLNISKFSITPALVSWGKILKVNL